MVLRRVIKLALDPLIQFHQKKIPKYSKQKSGKITLSKALDDIENNLCTRKITGHAAIGYLKNILESVTDNDAAVIEKILAKDLKCGVQKASANEVWPKLVTDYPVMLCSPYNEKDIAKFKFPGYIQLKMDGARFNAVVKLKDPNDPDGFDSVEFFSRIGNPLNLKGRLEDEFVNLALLIFGNESSQGVVFDGEILSKNSDGGLDTAVNRQTGNGILNKTINGAISDLEADRLFVVIWDSILIEDFYKEKSQETYTTRFSRIQTVNDNGWMPDKIELVKSQIVDSLDIAREIYFNFLAQGEEGAVLKAFDNKWESKRVKSQIKFKDVKECDLIITGVTEGNGRMKGMVGSIRCESSDTKLVVDVGTGLTDKLRSDLFKNIEGIVGQVIMVKYNAKIKSSKGGGWSLYLPVFGDIRYDKNIADSLEDIL